MSNRNKDLILTAFWITLALLFCIGVYFSMGYEPAVNFLTGYLVEKSLSVDNLFIFLLIFKAFQIPKQYRHKILFWGIFGAVVMRALFIFAGLALISYFDWVFYLFGLFLLYAGYKIFLQTDQEIHPEKNPLVLWFQKWLHVTHSMEGGRFFIRRNATPLFLALVAIETSDIIFALDSIPAIFGITTDPFIVLSSNLFAILGLRSLYFVLESTLDTFKYLHYGLSAVLVFIGTKMLLHSVVEISPLFSLGVILLCLTLSILPSLTKNK